MHKIILITGASSGLGKALAETLSAQGHTVYGTSRRAGTSSPGFRMAVMDVCDEESVQQAVKGILDQEGRLDVVINNAGIGLAGPLEHTSINSIQQLLNTNVVGVARVCQAVLPHMRERQEGTIINISSIGAVIGLPYRSFYCASKAAIDLLTEALRMEVAAFGIQACCIHAGDTKTNINANRLKDFDPEDQAYAASFEQVYCAIDREVDNGIPAEDAARQIARLVGRHRLSRYYIIGKPLQRLSIWIKRVLPDSLFERIMRQYSGM